MYAIIETGGKQYKVEKGDVIFIEKLAADENADITFDKVIAVGGDDGLKVGAPYVDGASVSAKVLKKRQEQKGRCFHLQAQKERETQDGSSSAVHQG